MWATLVGVILTMWFLPGGYSTSHFSYQGAQNQADTATVHSMLEEVGPLIERGELSTAKSTVLRARHLSDSLDYDGGKVFAAVRLGDIYLNQQKTDSAIYVLEQAAEQFPDHRRVINVYNLLATGYNYNNEVSRALEMYEKTFENIDKVDASQRDRTAAVIRFNMGTAWFKQGNTAKGFESYLLGIEFAEASGDTLFLTTALNSLGNSYNEEEEYEKASIYLERALRIAREKNYRSELYRINLNLANVRSNQERSQEALELYNRALELHREIRPHALPVRITHNLGHLYGNLGQFEKAKSYFNESLQYCIELGIDEGKYRNYMGLGKISSETDNLEEAVTWYQMAYNTAKGMEVISFIQDARERLYEVNRELGEFQAALTFFEAYEATADSLANIQSEQALASMENQLELNRQTEINRLLQERQGQQEKQVQALIILLIVCGIVIVLTLIMLYMVRKSEQEKAEMNDTLKAQKKELEELNKAKDKLFAIIAHDLRSPLSSMQSILYLVKNSDLSKEEIRELTLELEISVQKNVDGMEDLLAWAKEQMSGVKMNITDVEVRDVVETIISEQSFLAGKKEVEIRDMIPAGLVARADSNSLKLVIRNLISNAIKFTEPGDEIILEGNRYEDIVSISVKDTGIGMPPEIQESLFKGKSLTRKGTNNEKGSGFGLSLIREFVERMGGTITFSSKEGEGSDFVITLPAAKKQKPVEAVSA